MEVLRYYSNQPDLLVNMRYTLGMIELATSDNAPRYLLTVTDAKNQPRKRAEHRLVDRLSKEDELFIVSEYLNGTAQKVLAEKFGIVARSVRRILAKHGAARPRSSR
ncbi:hypothetical protein ACFQV2_06045 [Actinokineospora soli]|uniref:Sigma-70, region 4 n=1 Tax=Actinokineospora soli TaxID=1048753 RepID=A0ABW2THQ1_9PSEU